MQQQLVARVWLCTAKRSHTPGDVARIAHSTARVVWESEGNPWHVMQPTDPWRRNPRQRVAIRLTLPCWAWVL